MRFRKYLAQQYASEENIIEVNEPIEPYRKALPIISIYFLGHKLEHTKAPVIKVHRKYIDVISGREIKDKEEFIESLTHDSFIIQIPYLKEKRQTDLLILLSVFDQSTVYEDTHVLNVKEEDFPGKYRSVIRRLQYAIAEPDVRKTMDVEDEILEELESLERTIANKEKQIEIKEKVIEEKEKVIEEKEKENEEKEKEIGLKNKEIAEKAKSISEKDISISKKDLTIVEKDDVIENLTNIIEDMKKKLEEK